VDECKPLPPRSYVCPPMEVYELVLVYGRYTGAYTRSLFSST